MRISAKGRYALTAMIGLAQNYGTGEYTTVLSISERFGISKIYLEQVFSLLKRSGIVNSVKGAAGGYQLERAPKAITLYDILTAVELSLFEQNDATVPQTAPEIEKTLAQAVYDKLDSTLRTTMLEITLEQLVQEAEKHKSDDGLMFYI
jgi:Rrf2 family protein